MSAGQPQPGAAAARQADVLAFLRSPALSAERVIRTDGRAIVLDLGVGSRALGEPLAGLSVARFSELVNRRMAAAGTAYAFGRWAEDRDIYSSELFAEAGAGAERRSIHLGIDLFCAAGTVVHAPLAGTVHLKALNAAELDYGPLLVLEHATPGGARFYTLYGHLGPDGWGGRRAGQAVAAGEPLAEVGSPPGNGNWPPHLHLQLILDLCGLGAGFPGVARPSEQAHWLGLSPSPAMFFPEVDARRLDARAGGRS